MEEQKVGKVEDGKDGSWEGSEEKAGVANPACKLPYNLKLDKGLLFINQTGGGFGVEDDEESAVPRIRADTGGRTARREPVDRPAAFTERLNKSMGTGDELRRFWVLRFRICLDFPCICRRCQPHRARLCNGGALDLFGDQRIGAGEELGNFIGFGEDSNRCHFVDIVLAAIAYVEINGYGFRRDDTFWWQFRCSPLDLRSRFAFQNAIGYLPRVYQRIVFGIKDPGSKCYSLTEFNLIRDSEVGYFRRIIGEFFILITTAEAGDLENYQDDQTYLR